MKVNTKFDDPLEITIDSYIKSCGIKDVDEFLKPTDKYIEDWHNYANISVGVDLLKKYIGE